MVRAAAAALLAVCTICGCGGDAGDEEAVRQAVDGLYAGFADKDAGKVCGSLTREQRAAVAKGGGTRASGSCEQVMGVALTFVGDVLDDAGEAKVTKVELNGDKATATVQFKGRPADLGLAKEGGEWRVSDFSLNEL